MSLGTSVRRRLGGPRPYWLCCLRGAFGGAPLLADDQAIENLADENQAAGELYRPAAGPTGEGRSQRRVARSFADSRSRREVRSRVLLYLVRRDPRLAFDASPEGRDKRIVSIDKIWTPQPQLMDDLDVDVQIERHGVHVYRTGRCVPAILPRHGLQQLRPARVSLRSPRAGGQYRGQRVFTKVASPSMNVNKNAY